MENVTNATPEVLQVRIDWSAVEAARPCHVNQAMGQVGPPGSDGMPDGIFLTMGIVPPPPLMHAQPDIQAQQVERLKVEGVKVNVLGQFHMSRQVLRELITVLQETAAKYDVAVEQAHRDTGQNGGGSA